MAWRELFNKTPDPEAAMTELVKFLTPLLTEEGALQASRPNQNVANSVSDPSDAQLASIASAIYRLRQRRGAYFGDTLFTEPAWDMLLDPFINFVEGAAVSTTSLCLAAHVPQSTGLRYVEKLDQLGLIKRTRTSEDRRYILVALTPKGFKLTRRFLVDNWQQLRDGFTVV